MLALAVSSARGVSSVAWMLVEAVTCQRMQISFTPSTHTNLVTTNMWCQGRSDTGQFLLYLRLCSTDLVIDTVFLVVSKLPRFVELSDVS